MTGPVLLLLGDFSERREVIDRAAQEFGWVTVTARTHDEALSLCEKAQVVGLLFHAHQGRERGIESETCRPWSNGCRVRSIACLRPADILAQNDLEPLGAYHTILEPVCFSEVRLSLGFLAQAVARDASQRNKRVLPRQAPASKTRQESPELTPAGAAA